MASKARSEYDAPRLTIGLEPVLAGSELAVRLWRSGPREVWRAYKRLTQLSWPRSFPIVQFPNAPLTVAFLAGVVSSRTHGSGSAYAHAISYLAMGVWAYQELADGVNWFRHLLGLAYTFSTVVHLALALQR